MIYKDIIAYYDEVAKSQQYLEIIQQNLLEIKSAFNSCSSKIIDANLSKINSTNFTSYTTGVKQDMKTFLDQVKKVELYKVGKMIAHLERVTAINKDISLPVIKLIESLDEFSDLVHKFVSDTIEISTTSLLSALMFSVDRTLNSVNILLYTQNYLNIIDKAIETNIEYSEESILSIRLFRENMTTREISAYMVSLNDIYERVCAILDISTSDYALRPVKIESGSWFEKVFGHPSSIKFMQDLLNRFITFIYRNYTTEGKLINTKKKIDALKEAVDIIAICEEHGIKTEKAKKIAEENLDLICKNVYLLTAKNSKIAVNEKIFDLGEEASNALLEASNINLLEDVREVSVTDDTD